MIQCFESSNIEIERLVLYLMVIFYIFESCDVNDIEKSVASFQLMAFGEV
jgi:hypothetical protein